MDHSERVSFVSSLAAFILDWDCRDFVICGNFNANLSGDERWGSSGFDTTSEEFVGFLELLGLYDVPFNGSLLTFFNSGFSSVHSRLDWFIISSEAGGWNHNMIQRAMFKMLSDHIPIVLSSGQILYGPRLFRFFNTWCKGAEPQNLVSNLWHELDLSSSSLWFKFSQLRAKIRNW